MGINNFAQIYNKVITVTTSISDVAKRLASDFPNGRFMIYGNENSGKEYVAEFVANICHASDAKKNASADRKEAKPILLVNTRAAPRSIGKVFNEYDERIDVLKQTSYTPPQGGVVVYACFDGESNECKGEVEDLLKERTSGKTIIIAHTEGKKTPKYANLMDVTVKAYMEVLEGAPIRKGEVSVLGEMQDQFYFTIANGEFSNLIPQGPDWERIKENDAFIPVENYSAEWVSTGTPWLDWMLSDNLGMPKSGSALIDIGEGLGELWWPMIINYSKNAAALGAGMKGRKVIEDDIKGYKLPKFADTNFDSKMEEGVLKICSPGTARERVKMLVNRGLTEAAKEKIFFLELGEESIKYTDTHGELPAALRGIDDIEDVKTDGKKSLVEMVKPFGRDKNRRLAIDISADTARLFFNEKANMEIVKLRQYATEYGDTVLVYDKNCDAEMRKAFGDCVVILRKIGPGIMGMRNPNKNGGWYAAEYEDTSGTLQLKLKQIR